MQPRPPLLGPELLVESANTSKASLFTLIVVAYDPDRLKQSRSLVQTIAERLPCKIIFISIDPQAQESFLRCESTTQHISDSKNDICFDVLSIEMSRDELSKAPFLILPEIIADLPAYLLIDHDLTQLQPLINDLQNLTSRIAFDIAMPENLSTFARNILSLPYKQKLTDINWTRTKPWRETLFNLFDNPQKLSELNSCQKLHIRYSQAPTSNGTSLQAIFLQAWLASRLGWTLSSVEREKEHFHLQYTTSQEQVSVTISPEQSPFIEHRGIIGVEIQGDDELHMVLSHEQDDRHITVRKSTKESCELPYVMFVDSLRRGRALPSELFLQTPSDHYLPMIEQLSNPLWDNSKG